MAIIDGRVIDGKDLPALHRQDSDKSEAPQAKE